MSIGSKLQFKPGQRVAIVAIPAGIDIDLPEGATETVDQEAADAVVLFVTTRAQFDERGGPLVEAALGDRLAWVAYPKAGQLGTDLNRDLLAEHLSCHGIQPVRQIAIDDRWSALRFRPRSAL